MSTVKQRGDTIIEVLFAMSVIGIVLAAAFGIANQAVRTGRDAHERGEALKLAESQLELLKSYKKAGTGNIANPPPPTFCVDMIPTLPNVIIDSSSNVDCSDIDSSGNSGGLYSIDITENGVLYTIDVTWDQINSQTNSTGKVTLYYRTGIL